MVCHAIFSNISAISWRSGLLVDEIGVSEWGRLPCSLSHDLKHSVPFLVCTLWVQIPPRGGVHNFFKHMLTCWHMKSSCYIWNLSSIFHKSYFIFRLGEWCVTPFSAIFQLYRQHVNICLKNAYFRMFTC
jgi:hypothetical protein